MEDYKRIGISISEWIKDYSVSNSIKSLIVGISGGIDSALVSSLCASTGIKTYVVSLPIKQKSDQLQRARNHFNWLSERYPNVKFIEKDLTEVFETFCNMFDDSEKSDLSLANTRSRIRMTSLYQIASIKSGIVVGTGNKIEDFGIGFFTKYGDGGVDISPIADLTKSEVRKIASEIGILEEIILAKPTDGLWDDDHTDEDQIGASYEELEFAMDFNGDFSKLSPREIEVLEIYRKLNTQNNHKMIPIPIFKK